MQNRPKIDQKTESKMDGILASIFLGFWSILGGKLGGKPEPRSTQKGIEKRCKKEEQRDCQKSRNKNLQRRATPGSWVLGRVPPYPGGETRSPMTGLELGRRLDHRTCGKILRVVIVFKRLDSPANSWILLVIDVLSRVSGIIEIVVSLL